MRINGASSQTGVKYICWVLESESIANSHGGPKHGSLAHSSTMCEVSLASDASPIWAHTRAHYTCVSICAMCLMVHCASRVAKARSLCGFAACDPGIELSQTMRVHNG